MIYVNTGPEKQDGQAEGKANERKLKWDEENRLTSIYTNGFISGYWYDASGERVVKTSGDDEGMYVNDVFSGARTETANFTAYINPYLVVSKGGQYTKHIYIGSQRIVSKLGDLDSYGQDPRRIEYAGAGINNIKVDYKTKYSASQQQIKDNYKNFEVPYYGTDNDDYVNGQGFCCDNSVTTRSFDPSKNDNPELYQYYYHSDHLGSSSLITNLDGDVVQHIEYVPFGEVFIEERNSKWNTPYLFNAKELDEETGLYYYGARYYDPRTSVWLSTDPLQEKYPNISSYAYTFLNPVRYFDPTGMDGVDGEPWNVIGIKAHAVLASHMSLKPNWKPEFRFWDNTRADLMYYGSSSGSIWLLKPVSCKKPLKFAKATIQLEGYIIRANATFEGELSWTTGTSNGNPKSFQESTLKLEDESYYYFYWIEKPEDGIIFYRFQQKNNRITDPITITEKELVRDPKNISVNVEAPKPETIGAVAVLSVIGYGILSTLEATLNFLCPVIIMNPEMYQQTGMPEDGKVQQ